MGRVRVLLRVAVVTGSAVMGAVPAVPQEAETYNTLAPLEWYYTTPHEGDATTVDEGGNSWRLRWYATPAPPLTFEGKLYETYLSSVALTLVGGENSPNPNERVEVLNVSNVGYLRADGRGLLADTSTFLGGQLHTFYQVDPPYPADAAFPESARIGDRGYLPFALMYDNPQRTGVATGVAWSWRLIEAGEGLAHYCHTAVVLKEGQAFSLDSSDAIAGGETMCLLIDADGKVYGERREILMYNLFLSWDFDYGSTD